MEDALAPCYQPCSVEPSLVGFLAIMLSVLIISSNRVRPCNLTARAPASCSTWREHRELHAMRAPGARPDGS